MPAKAHAASKPAKRLSFALSVSARTCCASPSSRRLSRNASSNASRSEKPYFWSNECWSVADRYTCTPQQQTEIFDRIKTLALGFPPEKWRLSSLITLLPADLRERLQVWTEGNKNGKFFDHAEDGFAISDDLSIEMGDLFQNFPVAAALFMDYAFYRIAQILDGKRYTVIEIEEAGFFFTYPKFYARLEIWAVTIRKLNAALVMATQSLGQLARVPNFEILKEN